MSSALRARKVVLYALYALITMVGLGVIGTMAASAPGHGQGNGNPADRYAPYVPGELLVQFQEDAGPNERANIRAQFAADKVREFRSRAEHWRLPPGRGVEQSIASLRNNPRVRYAEPNYIVEMEVAPNDPQYPELYGLNNTGQTGGTPGADIDAERAWNVSTGSHSVLVAVIDTGVDYNHPDLAANIWTNPGETPGNGVDDDGNGFVDDVHGYDFFNDDGDPFDDNGHGTHCSGTIGAVGDNAVGVAGVNWNVSIVGVKFLSAGGSGNTADAVASIDYATALGVDVMSNSWGGGGFSQTLLDAIDAAGAAGIAFVAAAGNSNSDTDVSPHYPSAYPSPNIIAVAATDHNDAKASFSSFGATTVDLGAPGVNTLSTLPGNSYGLLSGTSMATPHVSGAAALIRSVAPGIGVGELKDLLLNFADPVPSMDGITVSGGRLNAFFPIAEPDDTPPGMIGDLAVTSATSNSLFLGWSATGDDGDMGPDAASTYEMRYSSAPIDDANFDAAMQVTGEPTPGPYGTPESMEVLGLEPSMLYYFAVKAKDEWGNTGPISNVAFGTTLPPPTFASSPDSFTSNLFTGQSETHTLTLENAGVGTLDWSIPLPEVSEPVVTVQQPLIVEKGDADPRIGDPVVAGFGGPDAFGYRWIDSDEPGGPEFSWTDISLSGTPIAELDGDDEISNPIPLGFEVSFYGNTFDSLRVSTNGWLSFTSTVASGATSYSNQPLPTSGGPENLLAPLWDDLHFRGANRAVWAGDGSSFVVQYTDVDRFSTGSNLTFQVEIFATGEIRYRYHTVTGVLDSNTVGIQNATKDDGLTVAFNTGYIHDSLEVRIAAVPQWLTASPTSGRLFGGETVDVTVTADATGLDGGTYEGSVNVETNDPLNPLVGHPVVLQVTGAPAISAGPDPLDFGTVFATFGHVRTLQVRNTGTDVLNVGDILSGDARVTVNPTAFSLAARSSQDVDVTFFPPSEGTLNTTLTILSDASNAPALGVAVVGDAIPAPEIIVDPTSFSETLFSGNSVTRTLNVTNAGGSELIVDAFADLGNNNGLVASGGISAAGAGGPDGFGYRWRDSDESGGPTFDWVDITGTGTQVSFSSSDDGLSGAIGMGMTFPFYGNMFGQIHLSTNGWASFTAPTSSDFSNDPLPSSFGPRNLLAMFWDDLHLRSTGRVHYLYDGTRFIVQYTDVERFSSGSLLTFQVLLYPSGKIVYQYLSMSGFLTSATIGIQNEARDDALQVVYNADYVHDNLAIEISRRPDWLAVSPANAVIPPGGSFDFDVTFDATGLPGSVLNGNVVLQTNIPATPELSLPAELTVIGAPQVAVIPDSYDFGTRFVGYPHLTSFQVVNNGTDVLNVEDVTTTDPELFVEEIAGDDDTFIPEAGFVLAPGATRLLNLRWSPSAPGALSAEVLVLSDDPDDPTLAMPVSGEAIPAPVAVYSPSSFTESLTVGDIVTNTLLLENQGGSDLTFATAVRLLGGTPPAVHPPLDLKKEEPDPRPGLLGSGGPDMFGYTWKDSDEPGGPIFDWVDISASGTLVNFSSSDDSVADPVPLGMSFPFYGNDFTEIHVSTNGWAAFTDQSSSDFSNDPLPSSGGPRNLLAMFWDDLHMRSTGRVYHHNDGNRFILQYTDVERFSSGSLLTFQAILYPSGRIVYQYLSMSGFLTSATVGIQNEARDDALQVVYNSAYVHDNLAVEIRSPFDFLTVAPSSGTVPPGGFADLDITIDTTSLIGGDYFAAIDLSTNDPANAMISVPVTLHVTGFPAIAAIPASLEFSTVFVGVTEDLALEITNPGTDVLNVTNVTISGDYSTDTTPFSLAVGESRVLTVTYAPTTDGTRTGEIEFDSNATGVPTLSVPLTGEALFPPIAGVDPTSVETALPPNGSKTKSLELCNTGGSDLLWDASVDLAPSATVGAYRTPLDLPKGDESDAGTGEGIERVGGPDAFGYQFHDSDEPGGPVFDWVDISASGTLVNFSSSDDSVANPIPLGMSFPFYGNNFSEIHVSTNGWAAFTDQFSSDFSNDPLPSAFGPRNLLAPFWDDLHLRSGNVRYLNDGIRFILQYTDVGRFSPSSGQSYTFQVQLYPDGRIVYQYLTMDGTLNSSTIGIQNEDRNIALEVAYNESYMHDNLAVEFFRVPDWLTVDPTSGVVAAGECTEITLNLDSSSLDEGDWEALISILNNDPFNSLIQVPVLLHVSEVDLDYIDVEPNTLNLSSPGRTIRAALQLPEMYDPADVVIESVSIYGQLYANSHPISYEDNNGDGVMELIVKFDRGAFEQLVPEGDDVPVTITGEVRDTTWFTGTDHIRTVRPHVTFPDASEYLIAGETVTITWDPPDQLPADSYVIWLSRDGGETWDELAGGVTGTSYEWTVDGLTTTAALVRVFALDPQGVMGYDTSDSAFTIAGTLNPPNPAWGLEAEKNGAEAMLVQWKRPATDLQHGPPSHYRVLQAASPQGPWTEIASPTVESLSVPLGDNVGEIRFYRIIATNAAGDALP